MSTTTTVATVALEEQADEVAKKFADNWKTWNVTDTGAFLEYKRPYTLTEKQVSWLRSVWVKQYKWGKSRDRAYESRSIGNIGQTREREFLWQVAIHLNGSGTFTILVRK